MEKNIAQWEQELLDDEDRKQVITAVHYSYKLDAVKQYKGIVLTALAYSRLFFGDKEGAADYFTQSLLQDPDNYKAKFELRLLKKDYVTNVVTQFYTRLYSHNLV